MPLANRLMEKLIENPVIHVDETPLLLFEREGKKKQKLMDTSGPMHLVSIVNNRLSILTVPKAEAVNTP